MHQPKLNIKHLEALSRLGNSSEYGVLKALMKNAIYNCMINTMKIPATDPNYLIAKKSEYAGEIIAIKWIIKQVEDASSKLNLEEEK